MSIASYLDENGFGKMDATLKQIFIAGGCEPHCHICGKEIKVAIFFHLKPFGFRVSKKKFLGQTFNEVDEYSNFTATVQVMVCKACSLANLPLPPEQQNFVNSLLDKTQPEFIPAETPAPPRPPRGGCFLVSNGATETIIPNF